MFYALAKARKDDGGTGNMILSDAGKTRLEAELNAEAWAKENGFRLEGIYPIVNNRGTNRNGKTLIKGFTKDRK